jgi:sideroflexin-5
MSKRLLNLDEPEFNLGTYKGRLKSFWGVTNPKGAFLTGKQIKWATSLVDKYYDDRKAAGSLCLEMTEVEIKELRKAHSIYKAVIHPDSKKAVPMIFRMNWFVPANLPIVFAMICIPQTPVNLMIGQWLNQSYNAGLNYNNRNMTSSFTNKDLGIAYGSAVTVSISIALGARFIANTCIKQPKSLAGSRFLNAFVASIAIACAGFCNLIFMRKNEIKTGIDVKDKDGNLIKDKDGNPLKSKIAAKQAVVTSGITRSLLPLPQILAFPLGFWLFEKLGVPIQKKPYMVAADLAIVAAVLTVCLPMAIAFFPQDMALPTQKLEQHFHNLEDPQGVKYEELYFNKGL